MDKEGLPNPLRCITLERKGKSSGLVPSHMTVGGQHMLKCSLAAHQRRLASVKPRVDCSLPSGHLQSVRVQKRVMKQLEEEDKKEAERERQGVAGQPSRSRVCKHDVVQMYLQSLQSASKAHSSHHPRQPAAGMLPAHHHGNHSAGNYDSVAYKKQPTVKGIHSRPWKAVGGKSSPCDNSGAIQSPTNVQVPSPYRKDSRKIVPKEKTVSGRVAACKSTCQSPTRNVTAVLSRSKPRKSSVQLMASTVVRKGDAPCHGDIDDSGSLGSISSIGSDITDMEYSDQYESQQEDAGEVELSDTGSASPGHAVDAASLPHTTHDSDSEVCSAGTDSPLQQCSGELQPELPQLGNVPERDTPEAKGDLREARMCQSGDSPESRISPQTGMDSDCHNGVGSVPGSTSAGSRHHSHMLKAQEKVIVLVSELLSPAADGQPSDETGQTQTLDPHEHINRNVADTPTNHGHHGNPNAMLSQQSQVLSFIGDVTSEIVQRNTTTPLVVEQLCRRHIDKNSFNLPQDVMAEEVGKLLEMLL